MNKIRFVSVTLGVCVMFVFFYAGFSFFMLRFPVQQDEQGYYFGPAPFASPPIMEKLYDTPDNFRVVGVYHVILGVVAFPCVSIVSDLLLTDFINKFSVKEINSNN